MGLSEQQEYIVENSTDKSIFLASAACGKTTVLTEKVRRLLRQGIDPKKIVVITFTNTAANEMKERLMSDYKEGLYIGTIHGLANQLLLRNGFDTSSILSSKEKNKYDLLFMEANKYRAYMPQYDWLLLDEAQDSDEAQFQFMFDNLQPKHFFIVGDLKQAIYAFNKKTAQPLINLSKKPGVQIFEATENYRNGTNILAFAKKIIAPSGNVDKSKPKRIAHGAVVETFLTNKEMANLIKNSEDNYSDWCVLIYTRNNIDDMIRILNKEGIPAETFKQGDNSKQQLEHLMESDTVKVLTPWSAKGLEWKNVIVKDTNKTDQVKECYENVMYVCATRAKDRLYWFPRFRKKKKTIKFGDKVFEWE